MLEEGTLSPNTPAYFKQKYEREKGKHEICYIPEAIPCGSERKGPHIEVPLCASMANIFAKYSTVISVSYTHLTLPTNREV